MAAQADVPLTIRIKLTGSDGGGAAIDNGYYFTYGQNAAAADLNTLLGIVATSWSASIAPHIVPTYHLITIDINDLNSKTGAHVAESVSIAGSAAQATELSSGACGLVSFKEGLKYRGGHSRSYMGGMAKENLSDANTWTVAFQAALSAAVQSFANEIIAAAPAALGALRQVVVHRYGDTAGGPVLATSGRMRYKSVPLTTPITMPVTGYATNPQVASQRRRNQQGG
jgi:hypothetical protein